MLGDPQRTSIGVCGQTLTSPIGRVGEQAGFIDKMSARTAVKYPLAGFVTRTMFKHENEVRTRGFLLYQRAPRRNVPDLATFKSSPGVGSWLRCS